MSREKTMEEVREEFLDYARLMVKYWSELPNKSVKEKISGAVFSILTALDGGAGDLPAFTVVPMPAEEDKQYCIENDEDYYPENKFEDVKCDIAGSLHELFYKK